MNRRVEKHSSVKLFWMRITIPILACLMLFAIAIFGFYLPSIKERLVEEKINDLKYLVDSTFGVLEEHDRMVRGGVADLDTAKKMVSETLRKSRFGPEAKDYFWISDLNGIMIMHPYRGDMEGTVPLEAVDEHGTPLTQAFISITEETGEGVIHYRWQWKDEAQRIEPKVSYVRRFVPWGWIVGTGVYLDEVEGLVADQARNLIGITLAVLGVTFLLTLLALRQGISVAKRIRESEATLRGIFDQARQCIGLLALDGSVVRVNQTGLAFAGVQQEQVANRPFWETPWWSFPEDAQLLREALAAAAQGEQREFEARHVDGSGELHIVSCSVKPIVDEGGRILYLLAEGNDITDRKAAQGRLEELNRELETRVQARTAELESLLQTLRAAQEHLVESEKMAALGGLVAGVAHEINTPLGNGVTNVTYLQEQLNVIQRRYDAGEFRKSDFERFLKVAGEATQSMFINLRRASDLIQSFKQVAVDQEVEDKRRFNVREYLDEVLLSLRPRYKRTQHVLNLSCPNDIMMYSYPGVIMQVIANLVNNSLLHAFAEDEAGRMDIDVGMENGQVRIVYADNGRGMTEIERQRVYEPFFTTRRNKGGSGLGMSIVFNLVVQKLGGSIELQSSPGNGVRYTILVPAERP